MNLDQERVSYSRSGPSLTGVHRRSACPAIARAAAIIESKVKNLASRAMKRAADVDGPR